MLFLAGALLISVLGLLEVNGPFLTGVSLGAILKRPKEELFVLVELRDASFQAFDF